MLKTLEQINQELETLKNNNQQAIQKCEEGLAEVKPKITQAQLNLRKAQKTVDVEAYDKAKRELWTAENTKKMLQDQLNELHTRPLMSQDEAEKLKKDTFEYIQNENDRIISQAVTKLEELRQLVEKSAELRQQYRSAVGVIQTEILKDNSLSGVYEKMYSGRSLENTEELIEKLTRKLSRE
ncbi:TPA: hypothetical protein ACGO0C_000509 [Streptococcus suis]